MRPSTAVLVALLAGSTLSSVLLDLFLSCRADPTATSSKVGFPFTTAFPLFFTICAAGALTKLAQPGVLVEPWSWMLLAVSILLTTAGLVETASVSTRILIPAL
ncbi:MAG: NrsF family protein [Pseudomonadota bacterium]